MYELPLTLINNQDEWNDFKHKQEGADNVIHMNEPSEFPFLVQIEIKEYTDIWYMYYYFIYKQTITELVRKFN